MKKLIIILLPIIALFIFALLNLGSQGNSTKIKIAGSFTPLASIISEVAGEDFEVISLIPTGVEPHDYEPLPAQQQDMNDSTLIFHIGMDFDNWLADSVNDSKKLVDLSGVVETRPNDPHYWLSYKNASVMASKIAEELKESYPQSAQDIDSNLATYQLELSRNLETAQERIAQLPRKSIITQHDAYQYLAKELNLVVVGTIEEAHGSEPSAQHLQELSEKVIQYDIKYIFAEPETQSDLVLTFAQDNKLEVIYFDAAGISTSNYLEMMEMNINNIVTALQ